MLIKNFKLKRIFKSERRKKKFDALKSKGLSFKAHDDEP